MHAGTVHVINSGALGDAGIVDVDENFAHTVSTTFIASASRETHCDLPKCDQSMLINYTHML